MATDLMSGLRKYNFTDELGHPLENCVEFQALIAQVQNNVKAACPSIPPAPSGHFHAEEETRYGMRTLDIFVDDDGDADFTITTREDSASLYLKPADLTRLRDWLNEQTTLTAKRGESCECSTTGPTYPVYRSTRHLPSCRFYITEAKS